MTDKSWEAHKILTEAEHLLDYDDPVADMLRALKGILILRSCREQNAASAAKRAAEQGAAVHQAVAEAA